MFFFLINDNLHYTIYLIELQWCVFGIINRGELLLQAIFKFISGSNHCDHKTKYDPCILIRFICVKRGTFAVSN